MTDQVLQGNWEDLVAQHDLRGRKVRITVLDDERTDNPWLISLQAWADTHKPFAHRVSDDRESIYSGTVDVLSIPRV